MICLNQIEPRDIDKVFISQKWIYNQLVPLLSGLKGDLNEYEYFASEYGASADEGAISKQFAHNYRFFEPRS